MRVESFIWDEHNSEKCQKHGLTLVQIEALVLNDPYYVYDEPHSQKESRFIAIGKVLGRSAIAVFTLRVTLGRFKVRVISARFVREKEVRKFYETEKTKNSRS